MPPVRRETEWLELEYDRGIFRFSVKAGAVLESSVFEEYIEIAEQMLGDDVPVPILVRLGKIKSTTAEAMRLVVEPRYSKLCLRCAIIVENPVARVIGSVFLGLTRPPYPTRLFSGSEDTALDWLTEDQADRQDAS